MGIKFFCPNGHKLNVKSFLAGKRGVCPECGIGVDIPNESDVRLRKGNKASPSAVNAAGAMNSIPSSVGGVTSDGGFGDDPFADILPVVAAATAPKPVALAAPQAAPLPVQPSPMNAVPQAQAPLAQATAYAAAPVATAVPLSAAPIAAVAVAATPVSVAPGIPMGAAVSVAPSGAVPPPPPAPTVPYAPDPLLEAPHAVWYIRPTVGGQFGPARGDLMRQWLSEGRVTHDSLVWREGWPEWKPAAQVFPQFGATAMPEIPGAEAAAKRAVRPAKKSSSSASVAIVIVLVVICIILFAVLAVVLNGGLQ